MTIEKQRVLVTGADGFIGSHLVEALVARGAQLRAFTYYNALGSLGWLDTIPSETKEKIEIFTGDIRDAYGVKTAMHGIDVVFHLAALIGIPFSYHSPDSYVDTNVRGTLNVVQAARELSVKRVVHTSTSEVYGSAQFVPMTEEHPLRAQSPYAATKIGADQIALSFQRSFGTPVIVVRPFNTYGPRQSARAVIPTLITQMLKGVRPVKIGALEPTRDFNFVTDTVEGFIKAAAADDSALGETFNIGSNFEISIGQVATVIAKQLGIELDLGNDAQRVRPALSEVDRLWADNSKACKILGWSPKYGGLEGFERGIAETIAWFKDPRNLASYDTSKYVV